jgi:hypothetical protein
MAASYVAGVVREVPWREERDAGEMFLAEVGVWQDAGGFTAYVKDGWGGGINSRPHPDLETARADVRRLWEKFYGLPW